MIGKESEEQPVFKVTDKRKFNIDGSLREGVELEPEKPAAVAEAQPQPVTEEPSVQSTAQSSVEDQTESSPVAEDEEFDETEMPGADDPASFVNFLTTLASQAASALGAVPHPVTGQRQVDLESGKYWIDVLAMLDEKTKGNLHEQESRLLKGLLSSC
jgi:hypothetical protein